MNKKFTDVFNIVMIIFAVGICITTLYKDNFLALFGWIIVITSRIQLMLEEAK